VIKSRRIKWKDMRNIWGKCIKDLASKHGGRIPLGTFRLKGEDDINMDLTEIDWEGFVLD
jgi:hypothetical protein